MPIGTDIAKAAELLRAGALVAIPTETVYGLAANAFDAAAVLKIFEAKQRPAFDPLIVHIHERTQLSGLVTFPDRVGTHVLKQLDALMERFWPGPLTLVLPKHTRVPDLVTSGLGTVAVRMPAHPMAQAVLRAAGLPLAAPSANPFGYVSPTTAQHVADQLGDKVPYILDGGACTIGLESTIIGLEPGSDRWLIYRVGGTPVVDIEEVVGGLEMPVARTLPASPGMLESHYAPHKAVHIGDIATLMKAHAGRRIGVISFTQPYPTAAHQRTLSASGDLREAARHLFAALRELDAGDAEVILTEVFPMEGLGAAINDRLRRAAAGRA